MNREKNRLMKLPKKRRALRCESLEPRRVLAAFIDIQSPDIAGGSTFNGRVDDIVIDSFRWSVVDATPGNKGGIQVQDFRFLKQFDKATPDLIRESAIGPIHDLVSFNVLGSNGEDVLSIDLTDARLTQFSTVEDESDSEVFEDVALSFTGIKFGFKDPASNPTKKATVDWDLRDNDVTSNLLPVSTVDASYGGAFLTIDNTNIDIESFRWGASLPVTFLGGSVNTSAPAGSDFTFTRGVDLNTPSLFSSLVKEQSLGKSITLSDQRSVAGNNVTDVQWTIYDPFISSFAIAGDNGLPSVKTEFRLTYSKVDFKVTPYEGKVAGTPTSVSWNLELDTVTSVGGFGNNDLTGTGETILTFPNGADIKLNSFNWSESNSVVVSSTPSQIGEFNFDVALDQSSPGLIAALATGTAGEYQVTRPLDSSGETFVKYTLTDGYISGYSAVGVSEPGFESDVSFSIAFGKVEREQVVFKSDGKTTASPVLADWSQLINDADNTAGFGESTLDKPTLELTFNDGGAVSDVSLFSINWSADRDEFGVAPDRFSMTAPLGIHSAGLFSAVAETRLINSASIKRHQLINSTKVELYRWDLSSVVLTDYQTTGANGIGFPDFESFNIKPGKIKLTTFEYDKLGVQTSTSFFEWDTVLNKTSSNNIGKFGDQLATTLVAENSLSFADGSAIDLEGFNWDAVLPVALPSESGDRKIGGSSANDFEFVRLGLPLTSHLRSLVDGKSASTPVKIESSVLNPSDGKAVDYANWDLDGLIAVNSIMFYDDASNTLPFNGFTLNFDEADLQLKQFANDGTSTVTNTTSVQWDLPSQIVTNPGGFGSFKFHPNSQPKHILEVTSAAKSPELRVLAYLWGTSNPIDQLVGQGKNGDRQGAGRTTFQVIAEYSETSAGFIASLAQGALIDALTLTSYDFSAGDPRPYREWDFQDVFVSGYFLNSTTGNGRGTVGLTLDFGRVVSTITTYEDAAASVSETQSLGPLSAPESTTIVNTFTSFVDYISPPQSTGIPNVQAFDLGTATVDLPNFFTDEQESSTDLKYSFAIDSNPGLFDGVSINANHQLILDTATNQTGTATLTITATDAFGLVGSTTMDVLVGLAPDFGDAPVPYPTTLASNGASHQDTGPRLGALRDREPDGLPSPLADGDGSDEDGVMFGVIQVGATMAGVNIDLQNAATAKVDAWVDFNGDGVWSASEKILNAATVNAGTQTLNFNIGAGAVAGQTFARVRVSTAGGLLPTGAAPDGEVEDYLVNILPVAPQVENVTINNGDASRSKITSVTVQFDTQVDHTALDTAFTVTNITTGTPVGVILVAPSDISGKTTAVLTFSGASTLAPINGSLATTLVDGNYRLDVASAQVRLGEGNLAAMATDYLFGNQLKTAPNNDNFYRWYGDDNGDGFTDFNDFAGAFLPAFGNSTNYNEGLDANGDGFVDFTDFANAFLPKFGTVRP